MGGDSGVGREWVGVGGEWMEVSGGVTGGFGWVQTHPLSKKAPMRFSQIKRLFGGWGGGSGGEVEREKA